MSHTTPTRKIINTLIGIFLALILLMNLTRTSFNFLFIKIQFPLIGIMIAMFIAGWYVSQVFGGEFSTKKLEELLYSVEKNVETKIDKAAENVKEVVGEIQDAVEDATTAPTTKKVTPKKTAVKK